MYLVLGKKKQPLHFSFTSFFQLLCVMLQISKFIPKHTQLIFNFSRAQAANECCVFPEHKAICLIIFSEYMFCFSLFRVITSWEILEREKAGNAQEDAQPCIHHAFRRQSSLFFFSPMPLCADIFFDFLLIACERMELLGPNSNHQMKEIHRESRKTEWEIIVYPCSVFFVISARHSQHAHPAPLPWFTYIKVTALTLWWRENLSATVKKQHSCEQNLENTSSKWLRIQKVNLKNPISFITSVLS